jgi:glycosyltransferase involved in cell wall biosynthesis
MHPAGISACLIARDEEELLPACLDSLRGFVDELCLLDTGSTDRTVAIAEEHGARIGHFAWCDDFSAARNASLAMATQPWISIIDADERLDSSTGARLREAATSAVASAFLVTREDREANGITAQLALPRLFRNDPRIRFNRPVHESIMESLFALGVGQLDDCGARLVHLGYLPEILAKKDKRARNRAILRRRFHEVPGDLYNAYKLAGTLGADANAERLQAFAAAEAAANLLSDRERAELPFLTRLFDAHAAALHSAGQLTQAIAVADRGLAQLPKSS